jgi:hypothetical protein
MGRRSTLHRDWRSSSDNDRGRRLWVVFGIFLAISISIAGQCDAANIEIDRSADVPIITITGTLKDGDGESFAEKISGLTRGVVLLASPGGNLFAGLRIGKLIHLKKFSTAVPDGPGCASACAIAWLGGVIRYMGQTARVGFHAAYRMDNGRATETGAGNALVGAYLNELGLSDAAIVYVTAAPPNDIAWLSIDAARQLGITVVVLPPIERTQPKNPVQSNPMPQPPSAPQRSPSQPPAQPKQKINLDEVARTFATTYFVHWSESNADALRYFASVYGERINFLDKPIPRRVLLDEKRKYADRWPERIYTAYPATIKTSCDLKTSKCTITGQVEWDCRDPKREARSVGLSDFTLQITVYEAGAVSIDGEWSSVVSRRN